MFELIFNLFLETINALTLLFFDMIEFIPYLIITTCSFLGSLTLCRLISNKYTNTCYNLYSLFYRITLILMRLFFITFVYSTGIECIGVPQNLYFVNHILLQIFLFDQTNTLAICVRGQKITTKRIIYSLSSMALLVQSMNGYYYLPILFLCINHLFDTVKDIFLLFTKNIFVTKIIYGFKPVCLASAFIYSLVIAVDLPQIIFPFFILLLSISDSVHRLAR